MAFYDRRGDRLAASVGRPPILDAEDAIARLEESLRAEGIAIDADTTMHGGGGGFDLGWAVELVVGAAREGCAGEGGKKFRG